MIISEIKLYELLKQRIGEREAEAFIQILDERVNNKFEEKKLELATKKDIADLKVEMFTMKGDLLKTIYITSLGQLVAIVASVISLTLVLNK